jgi:hypothetical protein
MLRVDQRPLRFSTGKRPVREPRNATISATSVSGSGHLAVPEIRNLENVEVGRVDSHPIMAGAAAPADEAPETILGL